MKENIMKIFIAKDASVQNFEDRGSFILDSEEKAEGVLNNNTNSSGLIASMGVSIPNSSPSEESKNSTFEEIYNNLVELKIANKMAEKELYLQKKEKKKKHDILDNHKEYHQAMKDYHRGVVEYLIKQAKYEEEIAEKNFMKESFVEIAKPILTKPEIKPKEESIPVKESLSSKIKRSL